VGTLALAVVADAPWHGNRVPRDAVSSCRGLPIAGRQQRGQHPKGGALPRAVRPEKRHDLTGRDVDVDATYGLDDIVLHSKAAEQALRVDHGHLPSFYSDTVRNVSGRLEAWQDNIVRPVPRALLCGLDVHATRTSTPPCSTPPSPCSRSPATADSPSRRLPAARVRP